MIANLDMELRIHYAWDRPTYEALAYQDRHGYYRVYFEKKSINTKLKYK